MIHTEHAKRRLLGWGAGPGNMGGTLILGGGGGIFVELTESYWNTWVSFLPIKRPRGI